MQDKEEIARKVGVGAIIFNDLANSRIKDEIFDWDMLLNFNGETGPYIQYIYVRTNGVIKKAGYIPEIKDVELKKLLNNKTINTIKLLYTFRKIVKLAAKKNEPSILARYLIDLAQSYSNFYNEHKIICDDKKTQDARLYLTYACGSVLKKGAELLGMEMPDEM